jgi:hypothetical protein
MNALAATGAFTAAAGVTVLHPWQPVPINTGAFTAGTATLQKTLPPVPVNTGVFTAGTATRTTAFSARLENGAGTLTALPATPAPVISRLATVATAGLTAGAVQLNHVLPVSAGTAGFTAATVGAVGKGLNAAQNAAAFTGLTPTVTHGGAPVPIPEKPAAFSDPDAAGVRAYLPALFPGILIDTGTFQRQREGGGYGGTPPGPDQEEP